MTKRIRNAAPKGTMFFRVYKYGKVSYHKHDGKFAYYWNGDEWIHDSHLTPTMLENDSRYKRMDNPWWIEPLIAVVIALAVAAAAFI